MASATDTRDNLPAPAAAPASAPRRAANARAATYALAGLTLANARYWSSSAGQARAQLRYWRERAEAIEDDELREIALAKLRDEGFNAQAAAVLATLTPRAHRPQALRAIVALELLFDCLDGLSERQPLADERLFAPYLAALTLSPERNKSQRGGVKGGVGAQNQTEYLQDLSLTIRAAAAELPAFAAVAPVAHACATRSAQAQTHMHAAARSGDTEPAQQWATRNQNPATRLDWREYLAGSAAAVLTQHALIAAAADPATTTAHARAIDRAYMSVCALVTLLDCVVDEPRDARSGELGYITLYEDRELLALSLARTARLAADRCAQLPGGHRHLSTLAGAVAYWTSDPAAREQPAATTLAPLRRELRGLLGPPTLVLRAWRTAKRAKGALLC
jgi:tetraprenyl-beta-curcumene synthase